MHTLSIISTFVETAALLDSKNNLTKYPFGHPSSPSNRWHTSLLMISSPITLTWNDDHASNLIFNLLQFILTFLASKKSVIYCFRPLWNALGIKISFTNTRSNSFRVTQRVRWKLLFLVLDVAIIYNSTNFSTYFIWQYQLLYYIKQNIYLK